METRIRHPMRAVLAGASALLLLIAATPASALGGDSQRTIQARIDRGFTVGFDAAIVRPLSFAALAVGAAAFLPAAILTAPGGMPALQGAYEVFVETPFAGTFRRSLGDFGSARGPSRAPVPSSSPSASPM